MLVQTLRDLLRRYIMSNAQGFSDNDFNAPVDDFKAKKNREILLLPKSKTETPYTKMVLNDLT